MKIKISKGTAKGYVNAPPSKSMAHRMLICAGLSGGICNVLNIAESDDILATIDCLKSLGVECELKKDPAAVIVKGMNVRSVAASGALNCKESGSTLRFFIPICLLSGNEIRLTGSKRLLERPQNVYKGICDKQGLTFLQDEDAITVKGPLKSGVYELPGDVSSQFVSGLLFALPLLDDDSLIKITTPLESKSYIDMTVSALAEFGVEVSWQKDDTIFVAGKQTYKKTDSTNEGEFNKSDVCVEGDYSNAAFFEALNILGGDVKIGGLKEDSLQGDRVFRNMFCELAGGTPTLDISDCPDLGPVLFAVAAAKNGGTFTGTKRLKIKESDRGQAMAGELAKFGINLEIYDNEIVVKKSELKAPKETIAGHNDHRIVMANAVLLTLTGGVIEGAEAVSKSFPDFFERLAELGIEVEKIDN